MSKIKVALLVGHDKDNPGAVNAKFNLREFDVCKKITKIAASLLSKDRYELFVEENLTLFDEKKVLEKFCPDIIIENHMNSSSDVKKMGIMTIYETGYTEDMILANSINDALAKSLIRPNLGVFTSDQVKEWRDWKTFFLFDEIELKSKLFNRESLTILTEIDFISNNDIAAMLIIDDEFIKRAALGLTNGLDNYIENLEITI